MFHLALLAACPHHHHANCHSITVIYSFEEVDFDQIDENAIVLYDVDDTLIFDNQKKCPAVLIEPIIVSIMKKLKTRRVATGGLTGVKPNRTFGSGASFADWRIANLKKAGIIFNDPFKKTIVFCHLKDHPTVKSGIIFSAWHDKGYILKQVFKKTGCSFNKIIFFDDKEENVTSVAKAAEDLGVAYKGYVYKGAVSSPRRKPISVR